MTDFAHTTTVSWSGTGNSSFGGTLRDSADAEDNREIVVAASTEVQADVAIVYTRLKHLFIQTDVNMTLRTNQAASGTPADTIALVAGYPVSFSYSAGQANPFTVDVTTMFIQNATDTSGTLRLRILKDSTP